MHLFIWMLCIYSLSAFPHTQSLAGETLDQIKKFNPGNRRDWNSATIEIKSRTLLDRQLHASEKESHAHSASEHETTDLGDNQSLPAPLENVQESGLENLYKRNDESSWSAQVTDLMTKIKSQVMELRQIEAQFPIVKQYQIAFNQQQEEFHKLNQRYLVDVLYHNSWKSSQSYWIHVNHQHIELLKAFIALEGAKKDAARQSQRLVQKLPPTEGDAPLAALSVAMNIGNKNLADLKSKLSDLTKIRFRYAKQFNRLPVEEARGRIEYTISQLEEKHTQILEAKSELSKLSQLQQVANDLEWTPDVKFIQQASQNARNFLQTEQVNFDQQLAMVQKRLKEFKLDRLGLSYDALISRLPIKHVPVEQTIEEILEEIDSPQSSRSRSSRSSFGSASLMRQDSADSITSKHTPQSPRSPLASEVASFSKYLEDFDPIFRMYLKTIPK